MGKTTVDPARSAAAKSIRWSRHASLAPRAMAIFAKCVDARPGHVAGRLLPNGSPLL